MLIFQPSVSRKQWVAGADACLQGNLLSFEEMQRVHYHVLNSGVCLRLINQSMCIIPG